MTKKDATLIARARALVQLGATDDCGLEWALLASNYEHERLLLALANRLEELCR